MNRRPRLSLRQPLAHGRNEDTRLRMSAALAELLIAARAILDEYVELSMLNDVPDGYEGPQPVEAPASYG
ncbi:hypothetical protein AB0M87_26375 [Streptomyces sp. NPDC051320]|uniref:hypothetical protein n=1 Tax=Streptomyces sp. NPDC051320 TaxID=3154644 RepID=UPI0034161441